MSTPASTDLNQNPSASPQASVAAKSDFMAAEEIKGILSDRKIDAQERILRWVTESLGLSPAQFSVAAPSTSIPATAAHATVPSPSHAPSAMSRPKDIKAFVDDKKPKSDMQFAAVVAYYFRFETLEAQRKESITAQDLQDCARLAAWRRFAAPSTTLNNALNQGYFDRAERGEFKLNAVGENLVAMALPGTGEDKPNNYATRRNVRKPKQIVTRPSNGRKSPRK